MFAVLVKHSINMVYFNFFSKLLECISTGEAIGCIFLKKSVSSWFIAYTFPYNVRQTQIVQALSKNLLFCYVH